MRLRYWNSVGTTFTTKDGYSAKQAYQALKLYVRSGMHGVEVWDDKTNGVLLFWEKCDE